MPFAPITGKLRKRLWLDLSCALGLGISSAYAYWSVLFPFSTINTVAEPLYDRYGFHLKGGQYTLVFLCDFVSIF
jgi:hypothetical protein